MGSWLPKLDDVITTVCGTVIVCVGVLACKGCNDEDEFQRTAREAIEAKQKIATLQFQQNMALLGMEQKSDGKGNIIWVKSYNAPTNIEALKEIKDDVPVPEKDRKSDRF